jgi:hypothetical protein
MVGARITDIQFMTKPEVLLVAATWRRGDALLPLAPESAFSVARCLNDCEMSILKGTTDAAVAGRRKAGNLPYVASLQGEPCAYVWVGRGLSHITQLGLSFRLAPADRFLWDMQTDSEDPLILARLLQAVARHEKASRFWLVTEPTHIAAAGSAGFRNAGYLYREGATAGLASGPDPRLTSDFGDLVHVAPAGLVPGVLDSTALPAPDAIRAA